MKNKKEETKIEKFSDLKDKRMTRKEVLKKSGFIALSAATMMILVSNQAKAQVETSPAPPPGGAW